MQRQATRASRRTRPEPSSTAPVSRSEIDIAPLVLAGLEAHRSGDLAKAGALYTQALQANPHHADALNLAGALAFEQGRTQAAIDLIGRAIKAFPDHLDAYLNLAEALEKVARAADARDVCRKALDRAPDFAAGHARIARLHAAMGEFALALAHSRVALALDPRSVEALCARGVALHRTRKLTEADAAFKTALAIDPDDVFAITGMAALMNETDFTREAADLYERALLQQPDNPVLLAAVGGVLERDGNLAAALNYFDRALAIAPGVPEVLYRRGACLRDAGDFVGAEAEFDRTLLLDPDYSPALLALARMKRLGDTPNCRKRLGRIVKDYVKPARIRVQAGFALGEVLDRADEPDEAFASFTDANRLFAQSRAATGEVFDRKELTDLIDFVDRGMARDYAQTTSAWGNPTELPVFVVGMPRSGTTMVEQICASHSGVVGAGELRALQMMARLVGSRNQGRESVRDWDADFARSEADRHARDLAALADGASRVVDKTPLNLMRLGLIGAMYPNARVIWVRRDPRDVVVSSHLMYFGKGNLYSTDQANCAYAVREIDRLGEVWKRELKLPILEVAYEDVVREPEVQVRRIIEFLGLPWEPACLEFHRTERHVTTPSSWQVRQPVYSSSIGRWRRYEKHLGPMLAELDAGG